MGEWPSVPAHALQDEGLLWVEDGNHGEYRPRPDEFVDEGVAFIRAADMADRSINFTGASKISRTARERVRKGIGRDGDVLLSHKGTVGRVAIVPDGSPQFVCSPQTTFWRVLDSNRLDRRYLRYFLESPAFIRQLDARKGETDMAAYVSLTEQRKLLVALPPVHEQRVIADVLGALDDKIEVNQRVAALLSETASTRFVCSADTRAALASVAEVTMGASPPGDTYNEAGEGLPFYQGVRDFGERSPALRVWCSAPSREAHPGDTLVAVRAPVGRLNRAASHCAIGRGLASVAADARSCVYYGLATAYDAWRPFQGEGTVFAAITAKDLRAIEIKWPSSDRLPALERELAEIDDLLDATYRESETLAALRDTLLPELLSGRLRVPEAEDLVADVG